MDRFNKYGLLGEFLFDKLIRSGYLYLCSKGVDSSRINGCMNGRSCGEWRNLRSGHSY